jgi:hypothetical protein
VTVSGRTCLPHWIAQPSSRSGCAWVRTERVRAAASSSWFSSSAVTQTGGGRIAVESAGDGQRCLLGWTDR